MFAPTSQRLAGSRWWPGPSRGRQRGRLERETGKLCNRDSDGKEWGGGEGGGKEGEGEEDENLAMYMCTRPFKHGTSIATLYSLVCRYLPG